MKLVLKDGIHVFISLNQKYVIIRDYSTGRVIRVINQKELQELLIYLKVPHSIKEIEKHFVEINKDSLEECINKLIKIDIVSTDLESSHRKYLNVLIIGVGTTGSHIANDLKNLTCINKLIVVDPDKVDESNIYRQDYIVSDIGKLKVDVIKDRGGVCGSIIGLPIMCDTSEKIEQVCKKYKVDIVIQAGDFPSTRKLAKLTENAANRLKIPYITNSGYISQVVSLPEFYYPNNKYNFDYKHKIFNERLLFLKANDKVKYRYVANVGHVVAQQIVDYSKRKKPFKYGERGIFDINNLEWKTEKLI